VLWFWETWVEQPGDCRQVVGPDSLKPKVDSP
jgi:hypothetical protein